MKPNTPTHNILIYNNTPNTGGVQIGHNEQLHLYANTDTSAIEEIVRLQQRIQELESQLLEQKVATAHVKALLPAIQDYTHFKCDRIKGINTSDQRHTDFKWLITYYCSSNPVVIQ